MQKTPTVISPAELSESKNPEFPGGHQAFVKKILNNFQTGVLARLNISSVKAVASFVVEKDGSMGDIQIESYENEIIKKEFLKALKSVNTKWTPGEIKGEKVRMKMRQPLIFRLE
ncbi:hypothetical protein CEY12_14895 [Chryseobacterium sp. T16E-39]|nr:hypothetical protein CEY12_14895 [Chryseobacterium sp. T16E-39]